MAELTEDPLAPLVRHLRSTPSLQEFNELVPPGAVNPVLGPPVLVLRETEMTAYTGDGSLWIFRGFSQTGEPYAHVEGTGSCAITLEEGVPWSRKVRGKSVTFMQLNVYYHCDVTRDGTIGAPIAYDARDKCISLHKEVTKLLNLKDTGTGSFLLWGAKEDGSKPLKVVSSTSGRELTITPIPGGDGLVEGEASFDLAIFL